MTAPAGPLKVAGVVPLSTVDYPGELALTVFTQGCPWVCSYCHNAALRAPDAPGGLAWERVRDMIRERRGFIGAVVFSGGEPTLQEGLADALRDVRALGFRTGLHTAGMLPDRLRKVLPLLDWVGLDIKARFDERYAQLTGDPNAADRVRESLAAIRESGVALQLRSTVSADADGDAAHQLRTPIAAMRNLGEVALSRARAAAEYREALETMLGELDRLTRIVEQLLQLSRLEAGALKARFAPIPLWSVVEQVKQIYQPAAEARGVALVVEAETPGPTVAGIEELLIQLLGNLVDNALRHSPDGGAVRIQSGVRPEGGVGLAVTDGGPGIPDEFAQKIFERFAQVPGGETGTAGLGLPLAAQIAAVHGGELKLANPGQPGARFECRLPASV